MRIFAYPNEHQWTSTGLATNLACISRCWPITDSALICPTPTSCLSFVDIPDERAIGVRDMQRKSSSDWISVTGYAG
jgi:hypothetical protein